MSNKTKLALLAIVCCGLTLRLILASGPYNYDIIAFLQDVKLFNEGKNIYLYQTAYNYSPFIFYIIGIIGLIHSTIKIFPYEFVHRSIISFIDVFSLLVLLSLAKTKRLSPTKTALLFFLNPVSIIISGRHGQFDNIVVLFLLLALVVYYQQDVVKRYGKLKMLILLTASVLVKHILVYQVLLIWSFILKNKGKAAKMFLFTVVVFLLSLLPFIFDAPKQIVKQVFFYGGAGTHYGIPYFLNFLCLDCEWKKTVLQAYKYIFIIMLFTFSFFVRQRDLARSCLLAILFFFTFTSGIATQYFIIPIALGALFPTKWFYLYSAITTLFFLGTIEEFDLLAFKTFTFNTVWLFATLWFVSEIMIALPPLRKFYKRTILSTKGAKP